MEYTENIHETIEAYLDNELSTAERQAFEQQIHNDQDLALEVALSREMRELLAETPENELRKSLERLNKQVDLPKVTGKTSGRFNRDLWWLIPIVFLIGWRFFGPEIEFASVQSERPVIAPEVATPPPPQEQSVVPVPEVPQEESPAAPPPRGEESPPAAEKPASSPQPIAAAEFTPNPALELLIGNTRRSSEIVLEVTQKQPDVQVQKENDPVTFKFGATLTASENLLEQDFKLHLFSNDQAAYQDFSPLFTDDLSLADEEGEKFRIDFNRTYSLQPGLYYYVLEDFATEKIYYVQKFVVEAE